jgi:multidrug efflux pump subunit AcrA (membrane-fusion protein)
VVRALADLLLIAFVVMAALSVVIKLPVTVGGRFALQPVRGSDPVRAPRAGIVAEVAVVEGAAVERGALLFRLRSDVAGDHAAELGALEISWRGLPERIKNQRARSESQVAADQEQRRGLDRQVASLAREIDLAARRAALAQKVWDHARAVYAERLTSFDDLQAKELDVARAEMDLAHLQAEQEQARSASEKIRRDMEVRRREAEEAERALREEADRARVRLSSLRAAPSFGGASSDPAAGELTLSAPCAGTVVRLDVRASGAVVSEGEALGALVCAGEALRAEVSLVDSGMGLVAPGQRVKLFYDAFPYQRHGVRYGTVRWIGPAAAGAARSPGPAGPAFRVLVEPEDAFFRVRNAPYPLLPGMTGQAEIVVAEQSAIAYVFEPVRALAENFRRGP